MGEERRQALATLQELLRELFNPGELRRWMRGHLPDNLIHELPGESASPAEISYAAVGLLERHALIDDDLFDHLIKARERRRVEIDAVRTLFSQAAASRLPITSQSDRKQTWDRPYRYASRFTLALSVVWMLTRGYPHFDVSRALKASEDGVVSFLPSFHQYRALPALIITAALFTALFWLLSHRQHHRKKTNDESAKPNR